MNIRNTIVGAIEETVSTFEKEWGVEIDISGMQLDTPEVSEHGDYASNIAMVIFSNSQRPNSKSQTNFKNPRELAEKIVKILKSDKKLAKVVDSDGIEVAGPGFINFHLNNDILINNLMQIDDGKRFGTLETGKGKKVIVEYSSPNIAKPFTVGHLRSTIIGDAVANLLEAVGYEVYRDNHLGDWGTQFGKQIYAIKTWGKIDDIEKSKNPVKELVALYVKFHKEAEADPAIEEKGREWFKKLENGDKEARELWQKCIDWSWKEFSRIYSLLGVNFSKQFNDGRGLGESFFEDKMDEVVKELEDKGLLKEGEKGAKLVFFENDKYPPAMIIKSDGATLYHTRDLATDKYRLKEFGKDVLIVNEVGSEQTLYFKQLFEMEKMLGWLKLNQRVHLGHGLIRFKEGKMSTRKGNVIWLEDILKEAEERAYKLADDKDKSVARITSIGALKYNDLKRDPKTNIVFDWDEMLNMQGNSGPYLQYTYARTQSVLGKIKNQKSKIKITINNNVKIEDEEKDLLRSFVKFPEVVAEAAEKYSPNLVCNYLFDLAQKYNTFYNKHKIIGSENEDFRLAITKSTGQILKNGLNLLGIQAPEKM